MASKAVYYIVVDNGSGDYYYIPEDKEAEWYAILEDVENFTGDPEWAVYFGGYPTQVRFKEPQARDN